MDEDKIKTSESKSITIDDILDCQSEGEEFSMSIVTAENLYKLFAPIISERDELKKTLVTKLKTNASSVESMSSKDLYDLYWKKKNQEEAMKADRTAEPKRNENSEPTNY